MSSAARRVVLVVMSALALPACSAAVKPATGGRGRIDDPRTTKNNRVSCLRQARLPVQEVGQTGLQIGSLPAGPTVVFAPTPGSAQAQQIQAESQGAEAIGSALLYPNQAPDPELQAIEDCLAKGVSG
jgi:hypothetical protein